MNSAAQAQVPTPKVSVIMPFFNCEKFLDQAIQSVLGQSFSEFELILIDDASTDGSAGIARGYLRDSRVLYLRNEVNRGIAYNENLGLRVARSEIIARMDGDDVSAQRRFERQFDYLLANTHVAIVGSFAEIIDECGTHIDRLEFVTAPEKISKTYFFHYPLLHGSAMFRKSAILNIGGYSEVFSLVDDTDMLIRLLMSGQRAANIPEYLLSYRKHSNSTHFQYKKKRNLMFKSRMLALRKYKPYRAVYMYLYTYFTFILETVLSPNQKAQLVDFAKKNTKLFK